MFRDVPARPNYVELEQAVLRLWAETQAFEQLRSQTRGGPKWSFLDGPITANNPMGVHHAWGRTYKDLYNRFRAMLGHELRWQQGFDCQGLWVEVEVEKELGFTNKRQIEEFGVANFVNRCKERVYRYADRITEQSKRLGYWMDWDNSYFTLSDENNYGIWGFLKLCHTRGWLYRGHDVMPWCPRCSTTLSEHEIATEGYVEKTHLAVTVAFPLLDRPGEALLAWTTTPWTLPANVAAAVHPELTYVRVEPRTKNKEQRTNSPEPRTTQRVPDREPATDDKVTRRQGDKVTESGEVTTSLPRHPFTRSPVHPFTGEGVRSFWLVKGAFERLKLTRSPAHPLAGAEWEVVEERPGSELVGWPYRGPFDELAAQSGVAHRVVPWSEVSEGEGTGVVHIAPGAGKEDFALGREYDLPVLAPLDESGVYVAGYGWLSGHKAGAVAEDVAADLERKGLLFDRELYTHRYPVCWRCGTELVFRLVDEWLIAMDELRSRMIDTAREAAWIPTFGLERELDWLRNMDDWMISKKRYWGLALPIYPCAACGHVTVVGSKEELRERAVEGWEQFEGHSPHRPWVDAVKIACEQCGAPVARVPDVGNPWLDAGIVAFSTLGYRHDREYWQQWFPADLVIESFPGQFRNWFYALLAMSTALEGQAPFKTLLGYALVKDEHGEEMHKSKGNAIWFEDAAGWLGVEPLRWLFAAAPLERNLNLGRGQVAEAARRLQPLWEVYRFFVTYANLDRWNSKLGAWRLEQNQSLISNLQSPLDQWLLARLRQLVTTAYDRLDVYDVRSFTQVIEVFLDDLSNWYVRRSRRRFWGTDRGVDTADQAAAFATLYVTLVTLARLLAPVLPFLSEALYQNLVRSVDATAPESVHLTGYPLAVSNLKKGEFEGTSLHLKKGEFEGAAPQEQSLPLSHSSNSKKGEFEGATPQEKSLPLSHSSNLKNEEFEGAAPQEKSLPLSHASNSKKGEFEGATPQEKSLPLSHSSVSGAAEGGTDEQLLEDMAVVRRIVELGRVARKSAGLRVRQPLARMAVVAGNARVSAALLRHQNDLLDELNVKSLEVLDGAAGLLRYHVKPNLRLLGPRLGKRLPALRAVLEGLDGEQAGTLARAVERGQLVTLPVGEEVVMLAPDEVLIESAPLEGYAVAQSNGMQVALDTTLTDALLSEGLARNLVRVVQEVRKAAGLTLSDRITLHLNGDEALGRVLAVWSDYLRDETLAADLVVGRLATDAYQEMVTIDGMQVTVGVVRRMQ